MADKGKCCGSDKGKEKGKEKAEAKPVKGKTEAKPKW
jgi:hypothetical protein